MTAPGALTVALGASFLYRSYTLDGQLALGIGLGIVGISIPLTALVLHASLPRRSQNDVTRDQDRVRDVQLVSAGQAEELAGIKVHLASIDLRLEKIEKKLYGQ